MRINDNIKRIRKERGITLEELGKAIGVSKQTIQRYESGQIVTIPYEKITGLASALHVSPAELMGWAESATDENSELYKKYPDLSPIAKRRLPILGSIACGEPILMVEEIDLYTDALTKVDCDFVLRAKGDSMINARIYDGDLVFIKRGVDVINGKIYAVSIDDTCTLKRVFRYEHYINLIAENPKYEPIVITDTDGKDVRIIGRAVGFQGNVI